MIVHKMTEWADYLISAVRYDVDRKIVKVIQHDDKDGLVGEGVEVDRVTVASNMEKGKKYMTVYSGPKNTWQMGKTINAFKADGKYCIRIDKNKVASDNLGDLVEF